MRIERYFSCNKNSAMTIELNLCFAEIIIEKRGKENSLN
ncbi:hypothetical protein T4A_2507 [Trichinella pseudospiralis]|uniref:Uncharacterized protein n=1 Tax=Trichinella pseudospiralis TaxID=6337 RepID=A0A0V1DK18_TRIPS|nr:hypothetical protein T4A_2507 [Trichinella pseudospiralis]